MLVKSHKVQFEAMHSSNQSDFERDFEGKTSMVESAFEGKQSMLESGSEGKEACSISTFERSVASKQSRALISALSRLQALQKSKLEQ